MYNRLLVLQQLVNMQLTWLTLSYRVVTKKKNWTLSNTGIAAARVQSHTFIDTALPIVTRLNLTRIKV